MPKGVAVYILFIVILIGLSIFATFLVLGNWIGLDVPWLSAFGCESQRLTYCNTWCHETNNLLNSPAKSQWGGGKDCPNPPSEQECRKACLG